MQLSPDSVAIVTGGARGLGWGIARAFGRAGARIKPTRLTWAEHDAADADLRASWADPVELGTA